MLLAVTAPYASGHAGGGYPPVIAAEPRDDVDRFGRTHEGGAREAAIDVGLADGGDRLLIRCSRVYSCLNDLAVGKNILPTVGFNALSDPPLRESQ